MKLPCETLISAFQRCVTWGEKTLDQWVFCILKLVENFKMGYLVGACEVFSSAVLSLDSVMPKQWVVRDVGARGRGKGATIPFWSNY